MLMLRLAKILVDSSNWL